MLNFSNELYNFEMESEEDEEEIIRRRRQQRQEIVNKYQGGTPSAPVSVATSVTSQSKDSDSDSDSSDSDNSDYSNAIDKQATEDLEKDLVLSASKGKAPDSKSETKDTESENKSNSDSNKDEQTSKNGDMFAVDDMFSEHYSVSITLSLVLTSDASSHKHEHKHKSTKKNKIFHSFALASLLFIVRKCTLGVASSCVGLRERRVE